MTVHYASGFGGSQYLEGARVGENLYLKPQETSCVPLCAALSAPAVEPLYARVELIYIYLWFIFYLGPCVAIEAGRAIKSCW